MKQLVLGVSLAVLAFGATGAAQAQKPIDGGRSFTEPPVPMFRDLQKWDSAYRAPRTTDGKPDLQGVWSSASLTQLERTVFTRGGIKIDTLVIPEDQIKKYQADNYLTKQYKAQDLIDPKLGPGDGIGDGKGASDSFRGYNYFWLEPGAEYARVNGEWRSSWIVSPDNGRVPYSAEGRAMRAKRVATFRASHNTGPEVRSLNDRCLSYGQQAGPPISNSLYNNNFQIVQTPTSFVLEAEMIHDARIIPIDSKPLPEAIHPWFGDSQAHWEGETLVVETRNMNPVQAMSAQIPLSPKGKITERFTRKSDVEILYEYTVDDPVYYSQPWKGEMPLRRSKERLYEYACHEGNYSLEGMVRGDTLGIDTAIEKDGE